MEVPQPSRLVLHDKLCRPHAGLVGLLRPGEAIYVRPVLRDHHEEEQVTLNESSLVLRPDRVGKGAELRLRLLFNRSEINERRLPWAQPGGLVAFLGLHAW